MKSSFWIPLLFVALAVRAERPPTPDDFALGLLLEPDAPHPIYRVDLPETVYAGVTRADLGDLRVFNARGEVLPHALRDVADTETVAWTRVPLPLFPMQTTERVTGAVTALAITTSPQGAVVHLDSPPAVSADTYVSHYLVDASQLEHGADRLSFTWSGASDDFLTEIGIARSSDLAHWTPLRGTATLARLNYQGQVLEQHDVTVAVPPKTYLRISWPAGRDGVTLTTVSAQRESRDIARSRHWRTLAPHRVDGQPLAFEVERTDSAIVDRVDLSLPGPNLLIEGRLLSRGAADEPWRLRHQGSFYRLQIDGRELTSDAVSVGPTTDRAWRLEVLSDGSGLERNGPDMRFGARNRQLYFVARGEPPYTLAFGSATIAAARTPVGTLLATLRDENQRTLVGTAAIREQITLGGADRRMPPPPPLPWRQWLLWAVLGVGVVMLAVMAMRLQRQLRG